MHHVTFEMSCLAYTSITARHLHDDTPQSLAHHDDQILSISVKQHHRFRDLGHSPTPPSHATDVVFPPQPRSAVLDILRCCGMRSTPGDSATTPMCQCALCQRSDAAMPAKQWQSPQLDFVARTRYAKSRLTMTKPNMRQLIRECTRRGDDELLVGRLDLSLIHI